MKLGMNNFSFNQQHVLQIHGTATGKFKQHAIDHAPFKPHIWFRYIDDIFMIWTEGEDYLKTFLNYINSIHPTIKFTHEYSNSPNQTLPFLDVQVHLNNKQIQADLHTKPTDKHQYYSRHLVTHTKRTIPFSLALRLRRICLTDDFFNKRCRELINSVPRITRLQSLLS